MFVLRFPPIQYVLKLSKLTTYLRLVVGLILFCIFSSSALAQDLHPHLKQFNIQSLNSKLLVTWTTRAGFTCQDVHIELSKDSLNWDRKATYYGICGDTTERDYSIVVDSPFFNAVNYVRLVLGEFGYSQILKIRVVNPQSTFQIVPHPANSTSIIYIPNANRALRTLRLHTLTGEVFYEQTINTSQFRMAGSSLSGVFIYTLLNENQVPLRLGRIIFQ